MREQLCWSCCNVDCEWNREFKPVPNWVAKPTKIESKYGTIDSYSIKKCPKYKQWDRYFEYYSKHTNRPRKDIQTPLKKDVLNAMSSHNRQMIIYVFACNYSSNYICRLIHRTNTAVQRRIRTAIEQYKYIENYLSKQEVSNGER